jgi:hypothetical protein
MLVEVLAIVDTDSVRLFSFWEIYKADRLMQTLRSTHYSNSANESLRWMIRDYMGYQRQCRFLI